MLVGLEMAPTVVAALGRCKAPLSRWASLFLWVTQDAWTLGDLFLLTKPKLLHSLPLTPGGQVKDFH